MSAAQRTRKIAADRASDMTALAESRNRRVRIRTTYSATPRAGESLFATSTLETAIARKTRSDWRITDHRASAPAGATSRTALRKRM